MKVFFKHNYCHACHTVFAVLFPLQSCCCVSSLLASDGDSEGGDSDNVMERHFEQNRDYSHSFELLDTVIRFRKRENHSLLRVESHKQIFVVIEG